MKRNIYVFLLILSLLCREVAPNLFLNRKNLITFLNNVEAVFENARAEKQVTWKLRKIHSGLTTILIILLGMEISNNEDQNIKNLEVLNSYELPRAFKSDFEDVIFNINNFDGYFSIFCNNYLDEDLSPLSVNNLISNLINKYSIAGKLNVVIHIYEMILPKESDFIYNNFLETIVSLVNECAAIDNRISSPRKYMTLFAKIFIGIEMKSLLMLRTTYEVSMAITGENCTQKIDTLNEGFLERIQNYLEAFNKTISMANE